MLSRRCIVKGHVQGVWFRDTTRRKALALGLSGSASNLPDGSVEVIACGDDTVVDIFCDWLWEGSAMSQVQSVECEPWSGEIREGFRVG